jgi:hypothetical protein
MDCQDCEHAVEYHEEFMKISKRLRDAIKEFNHGHFCTAIEEMEVLIIRLEQMHYKRMGR